MKSRFSSPSGSEANRGALASYLSREERKLATALASDLRRGKLRRDIVPMLPDESVRWAINDLPDDLGAIVAPVDANPAAINYLAQAALVSGLPVSPDDPRGATGSIRFSSDLACKHFYDRAAAPVPPNHCGILPLQANIALQEGLRRENSHIGTWKVKAPTQLGALLRLTDIYADDPKAPVWVMTRESGVSGELCSVDVLPHFDKERRRVLRAAFQACSVDPELVELNDTRRNYLVDAPAHRLVRHDVFAQAAIVSGVERALNDII